MDHPSGNSRVYIEFSGDIRIGDMSSLEVKLLDNSDNVLSTNVLNNLGLFLQGNEKGLIDENFTKILTEGNAETWENIYKDLEIEIDGLEFKAGATIPHPADGNKRGTTTTFSNRTETRYGEADLTNSSAWDQGAYDLTPPAKVLVEYMIDGVLYKSELVVD